MLAITVFPDGTKAASCSLDGTVRVWDLLTFMQLYQCDGHRDWVLGVAVSADGSTIASCSRDHTSRTWTSFGQQLRVFEHKVRVSSPPMAWWLLPTLKLDQIQQQLTYDKTPVFVKKIDDFSCFQGDVMSVALTADNQSLVTAEGKRLRILKLVGDAPARDLLGHSDTVRFIAMQADGARMASCSQDRTIILWKTGSWNIERILAGHDGVVRHVHLAADMLLSCSSDETLRLWSLETGRCKFVLTGHGTDVRGCAMSSDGSVGYSCGFDKTVRQWDLATGMQIAVLSGHTDKVFGVATGADGSWALSCSWDKTLRLWDPKRQVSAAGPGASALLTVVAPSEPAAVEASDQGKEMLCVALTGDGSRVVSCSVDGAVRIWDSESAEQLHKCTGHTDWVWGLAVTLDGALAASCSRDFTARVWDIREGREVCRPSAVQRRGCCLIFSRRAH